MRTLYHTLYIIAVGLAVFLLAACSKAPQGPVRSVVVIHSYADEGEDGAPFRELMAEEFQAAGMNVKIHHLYLDMVHYQLDWNWKHQMREQYDSLISWNPDVLLVNEDYAWRWMMETPDNFVDNEMGRKYKAFFEQVPIVIAGVTVLDKSLYNSYANITGFEDDIDLAQNLNLYYKITGNQSPTIELDDEEWLDVPLRKKLYEQIADTNRFINNADFHVKDLSAEYLKKKYPGKMVVNFVSATDMYQNRDTTQVDEGDDPIETFYNERWRGTMAFRDMLSDSKNNGQIQVHYSVESNTLITHSQKPQFTCIRHQFNNDRHNFLCGYFSSMQTQVHDQVGYAVRILQGARPKILPLSSHEKDYHMDYEAMEYLGMKYGDYENQFWIYGAPYYVQNPLATYLLILVGSAILIILLFMVFRFLIRLYRKSDLVTLENLKKENERRQLMLESASAHLWYITDDTIHLSDAIVKKYQVPSRVTLEKFGEHILEDSQPSFQILKDYADHLGGNKIRLHIQWNEKETHWYELSYHVTREDVLNHRIMGISLNIDAEVANEKKLQNIQSEINESDQKQNFLNNISHDLRTPLGAVTGFAQLITAQDMEFSPEELQEFNNAIHENSDMMTKMIQSVIEQSKTESSELLIKPLKSSAQLFVKRVYQTHQVLVPSHLQLHMEQDSPDRAIFIDPNKTRQVFNNFVSNAFKFTPQGSITLGWKYLPETEEIMIYCRDTGIGVSEENAQHLFDRYYKIDEQDKGTGLGLNISRTIIERQGGTIGVDSQLGKGSTFWFKLKEYKGK